MYVLATHVLYTPTTHGPGGPSGHFIVDTVWSREEFMGLEHIRRVRKHGLRFDIVKLTRTGPYYTCVPWTTHLRILQRKFRRGR